MLQKNMRMELFYTKDQVSLSTFVLEPQAIYLHAFVCFPFMMLFPNIYTCEYCLVIMALNYLQSHLFKVNKQFSIEIESDKGKGLINDSNSDSSNDGNDDDPSFSSPWHICRPPQVHSHKMHKIFETVCLNSALKFTDTADLDPFYGMNACLT